MTNILEIKLWPYPSLLTRCQPVTKVDKQLLEWTKEMKQIVINYGAAGLAANQVGLPYSIYVTADEVFINPVIQKYFGGYSVANEGCLSFPGMSLDIARSKKIAINAFDENGNEIKTVLTGMDARVAAHEVDHLNGLSFINRVTPNMLTKSGLIKKLNTIQLAFMEECDNGEINLAEIQSNIQTLLLERTAWQPPQETTTTEFVSCQT